MMWQHYLYLAAAWSNVGPASVYLVIMLLTLNGLDLPRLALLGSRNFFFGCLSTHVLMVTMMLAMLETLEHHDTHAVTVAALMLAVNLQQTLGGYAFMFDVARKRIRSIGFRPATDPERHPERPG